MGDDIRALRGRLGVSQAAFARGVGVHPRAVQRWEHGKRRLSPLALRAIIAMVEAGRRARGELRAAYLREQEEKRKVRPP